MRPCESGVRKKKKAQDITYRLEVVGNLIPISEPTPKRELFTYCLGILKVPTFQDETQSECFKFF